MISRLFADFRCAVLFYKSQGLRASIAAFMHRDAHPMLQFIKYGACGAISTIILLAIAISLNHTVLPAYGPELSDSLRERNNTIANIIAFPIANTAAYILNVLWVFTPGRHSKWVEFSIFTAVSIFSFGAGLILGPKLIGWFGVPTGVAQLSLTVTSALVNYLARKLVVFEK